ncbi:MAG TPA: ABC transporter permease subunit [Nocardioides sp.]|nr:ABC transporter permease subunit [Nocardioides sp.]
MTWLTWRQLRVQLIAVAALVAAAGVWLAVTGPHLARLARDNTDVYDLLTDTDRLLFNGGIAVLAVAPALLGIFWGAPLVARELETGTHRLAWTQSVTRTRWLAAKLGWSVLATAVAVGILTAAITWWSQPLDGIQGDQRGSLPSRMTPISFAMRGVVPVAYVVFAVVLGTFIGLLVRRSIAAMALTLAVYVLVQVAVPLWVRPHLAPPVTTTEVISYSTLDGIMSDGSGPFHITTQTKDPRDWVLTNQTVDSHGRASELPSWFADCLPPPPGAGQTGATTQVQAGPGSLDDCLSRLTDEGYRQRLVYQPIDHFWRLQWAETGLYLAVSALLAGLSFWWIRFRLS